MCESLLDKEGFSHREQKAAQHHKVLQRREQCQDGISVQSKKTSKSRLMLNDVLGHLEYRFGQLYFHQKKIRSLPCDIDLAVWGWLICSPIGHSKSWAPYSDRWEAKCEKERRTRWSRTWIDWLPLPWQFVFILI